MTPTRKSAWASECSSFTFYNRYNVAFTPNAYQLFTYAQLQFASLGLELIDTIPAGGTVSNIVSSVTDWVYSSDYCVLTLTSDPTGPFYLVLRVSPLSNSGNELNGLPLRYLKYYHSIGATAVNLHQSFADFFGTTNILNKSFILQIECIRYSGFAPGAKFSQIINIV